jgi:hypothetical protein
MTKLRDDIRHEIEVYRAASINLSRRFLDGELTEKVYTEKWEEMQDIILGAILARVRQELPEKRRVDAKADDWYETEFQQVKGYNTAIEEIEGRLK